MSKLITHLVIWGLIVLLGTLAIAGISNFGFASNISEFTQSILPANQCNDTADNDGDTLVDYPDDPDCESLLDDDEATTSGGASGGGSGGMREDESPINADIHFEGVAFPNAQITVLQDGAIIATTRATRLATFATTIPQVNEGTFTYSMYAIDRAGLRSDGPTYNITVQEDRTVSVADIVFAPTIKLSSSLYRQGDVVTISGEGIPAAHLTIILQQRSVASQQYLLSSTVETSGRYHLDLDTSTIIQTDYSVIAGFSDPTFVSIFSAPLYLTFSPQGLAPSVPGTTPVVDFDGNKRVDLADASRLIYWFGVPGAPSYLDLDGNGIIDLKDVSIFIYYWTG